MMMVCRQYYSYTFILITLAFLAALPESSAQENGNFYFKGHFTSKHHPASITLDIWDSMVSESKKEFTPHRNFKIPVKDGVFELKTTLDQTSYISLGWGQFSGAPKFYLELYQSSPGDSVTATINYADSAANIIKDDEGKDQCMNCYSFAFDGRGAAKYQAQQEIDNAFEPIYRQWSAELENKEKKDSNAQANEVMMTAECAKHFSNAWLNILLKYKSDISASDYVQLEADIISRAWLQAVRGMTYPLNALGGTASHPKLKNVIDSFERQAVEELKRYKSETLSLLPYYAELRVLQARIGSEDDAPKQTFQRILTQNQGIIRDRTIVNFIYNNESNWSSEDRREILASAGQLVKEKPYSAALLQLDAMQKGSKVYDFSLPDTAGKIVRLSDFLGKVVFIDFWFVGCAGCTEYYKTVVSKVEHFYKTNQDVVFITISIDVNKQKWLDGIKSGKYTSGEVINLHTFPSGINHPVIRQFNVKAFPHPLLIDKQGRVFSNSDKELRQSGVEGLISHIERALKAGDEFAENN